MPHEEFETAFSGCMEPGIELSGAVAIPTGGVVAIPGYLEVREVRAIGLGDRLDPASLPARCALVYGENVYATDAAGNVAYIHCRMRRLPGASAIRRSHLEYRAVGGMRATRDGMDAGHFGLSLGQHPSIAMEQDSVMNRYGMWRELERGWGALSSEGYDVLVRGVFVEGDGGTYSPYWCVEEIIDGGEPFEYILTNDAAQS